MISARSRVRRRLLLVLYQTPFDKPFLVHLFPAYAPCMLADPGPAGRSRSAACLGSAEVLAFQQEMGWGLRRLESVLLLHDHHHLAEPPPLLNVQSCYMRVHGLPVLGSVTPGPYAPSRSVGRSRKLLVWPDSQRGIF